MNSNSFNFDVQLNMHNNYYAQETHINFNMILGIKRLGILSCFLENDLFFENLKDSP